MILDENRELTEAEKLRVLRKVEEEGLTCGGCGSRDFEVGASLYMGFLFLSEGPAAHMVALTCKGRGCGSPRTGIRLHQTDFLWEK